MKTYTNSKVRIPTDEYSNIAKLNHTIEVTRQGHDPVYVISSHDMDMLTELKQQQDEQLLQAARDFDGDKADWITGTQAKEILKRMMQQQAKD